MIGFPFRQIASRSRSIQVYNRPSRLRRFLPFLLTGTVCAIVMYPIAYEYGLNARQKEIDDLINQQEKDFNKLGAQLSGEVAEATVRAHTAEQTEEHIFKGIETIKGALPKVDESQFRCASGYIWQDHYVIKKERIGIGIRIKDKTVDFPFEYLKCVKVSELKNE